MPKLTDRMPATIANWLKTRFGKHLSRFAVVALISLATTQITLLVTYIVIGKGGTATLIGWLAGAAMSYLLSRKAWDRKGRPHLIKETLPFWIISVGTGVALTATGHFASVYAKSHHMPQLGASLTVNAAVLLANAVTFAMRFLIFHYILFADRSGEAVPVAPVEAESLSPVVVTVPSVQQDQEHQPPQ